MVCLLLKRPLWLKFANKSFIIKYFENKIYDIFKYTKFETNKMPSFGNVVIERVTNLNYLGMIIDEMIPCKDHVRALSIKFPEGRVF